ncbi:MAG TPA: hypothetical protein VFS43_10560 [Polyangiaceae bacterium]|nr:hypothetical protein [Polyangiaceae bacterium]
MSARLPSRRNALAFVLTALALAAPGCADDGGADGGSLEADARGASAGRRGRVVQLDLPDPDSPVADQLTIPGANNLRVTVLELNNIVDDFRVRDGGNTPFAVMSGADREKGFLPYEVIVPGDTVRFTAGGLGSVRARVRDALGARPDNPWQIDQLEDGGERSFRLPGARGLRVQLTFHDLIEGEQVLRIESAAGVQEVPAEDLERFSGGGENVFRVPGDSVTLSVNSAVRSNGNPGSVEFAVTEDKAL